MIVNATEFQNNVGSFLQKAALEDIVITKNGKEVARLVGAKNTTAFLTDSLLGILPTDTDLLKEKQNFLNNKYGL